MSWLVVVDGAWRALGFVFQRSISLCRWGAPRVIRHDTPGGAVNQFFGRYYQAGCPVVPHLTVMERRADRSGDLARRSPEAGYQR